jgi:hypothetical protein
VSPETVSTSPRTILHGAPRHPNTLRHDRSEGSQLTPRQPLGAPGRRCPSALAEPGDGLSQRPSKTSLGTSRQAVARPLRRSPRTSRRASERPTPRGLPRRATRSVTGLPGGPPHDVNLPAQRLPRMSPRATLASPLDALRQHPPRRARQPPRHGRPAPCRQRLREPRGTTRRAPPHASRKPQRRLGEQPREPCHHPSPSSRTRPATTSRQGLPRPLGEHPPPPARRSQRPPAATRRESSRRPPRAPRRPPGGSCAGVGNDPPRHPGRPSQRSRRPSWSSGQMARGHRSRRRLTTCRASASSGTGGKARPATWSTTLLVGRAGRRREAIERPRASARRSCQQLLGHPREFGARACVVVP